MDFERCYLENPRKQSDRFQRYSIDQIADRNYNLDIIWLKDTSAGDADELPSPEELANEALVQLRSAMDSMNEIVVGLGSGKVRRE